MSSNSNKQLFLFAGEHSGDLHGSNLLKSLKENLTDYSYVGVGGPLMRCQGLDCLLPMEEFQVMGFTDVFCSFPKLWRHFYTICHDIIQKQPLGVILIDYPGFNLRLARALRKRGYQGKIIQYISPTVWAWGKGRIKQMADTLDLLLTIYPFETACFAQTTLHVQYAGNPLQELIQKYAYDEDWLKNSGLAHLNHSDPLIAIFPGSRLAEITRNLPKQLQAVEMLQKQSPQTKFALSCGHESLLPAILECLSKSSLKISKDIFIVPKKYSYELMRASRAAIAKSGTVTLELALHSCPTVVVYELSWLNRFIAQHIIRVNLPHYCIVNILAQKEVFPELIAAGFSAENLYLQLKNLSETGTMRECCLQECKNVKLLLKEYHASQKSAQAIAELLAS